MDISHDLLDGVRSFGDFGRAWLEALPATIERLTTKWDVTVERAGPPGSCSYIAVVRRPDGERAAMKIPIPHEEADHEPFALRAWGGDGAVKLLDLDSSGAMLLELVEPGKPLRDLQGHTEVAQSAGTVLRRLHRPPPADHAFRSLSAVLTRWAQLARTRVRTLGSREDRSIVDEGAELLEALPRETNEVVLLHGDFHHGNVLSATRESWLVIDAKPMVGDPAFDAAQFLGNHHDVGVGPRSFLRDVHVFAEAAELDARRMLLYAFAKAAEDAMWYLSIDRPAESSRTLEYGRFIKELLR